jgi:Right handed beta helix region
MMGLLRATHLRIRAAVAALPLAISAVSAFATTIEINPSTGSCNEEFENRANTLQPGDELVLHGGTYSQSCRRAITVNGTAAQPVIIRAATGEVPVLTNVSSQNNIDIVSSSYLLIRGLQFRGGSQGMRFEGLNHHVTVEDNEVHSTDNNAIALNSGNADAMIFRHNHIHDTGKAAGDTEGEGMYLGCHDGSCRVTNSIVEGNYIHHLRGTSSGGNDGIEVKATSAGNIIRNNVIHDTNIGTQYPCILVYGGGVSVNTVEGNAMWNCGEGIYAVADAVVRNNIVLNSGAGISSYPHAAVAQMRNITIVNNTLYGHQECFFLRWSNVTNVTLANNAAYCGGNTAVNGTGLSSAQVTIRSNYIEGSLSGASVDNSRFFAGGSASTTFVNAPSMDLWPRAGSILLGKADNNFVPSLDFNETPRTAPYDVGAYETNGLATNPGWKIVAGFKPINSQLIPPSAPTNLQVQ